MTTVKPYPGAGVPTQTPIISQPAQAGPTTVIVNQPPPTIIYSQGKRSWSTGLCSIFDDMGICFCAMCCPLCLTCSVSEDMGESFCLPCLVPDSLLLLRVKLRTQENIEGSILDDCITVGYCGICALCQMAREVKAVKTAPAVGQQPQ